jgi:hypothetical protein
MSGKVQWTEEGALEALRQVLLEHGQDLPANSYDRLPSEGRPARSTLERHFGSWSEAKNRAIPEFSDTARSQLVDQNQRILKQLEKERDRTQAFIDNCLAAIQQCSFRPVKIPAKSKTKENLEFHSIRSDAHVGDYTDQRWVQGLARYSKEDYVERVQTWTEKVILFKRQDANLGLHKLVLYHLGDQVTGEGIYEGQPFYLDLSLTDQLFKSVEVESNALLALAAVFPQVEVFCVPGNHGRPGRKGANHQRTNFDYIFYRSLKAAVAQQKNIAVYVSESPTMLVEQGDYLFALTHGDAAQSWAGIPYYGREREFQRLSTLYGHVVHYELVGHHHTPGNLGGSILMNGSLKGGDDLSVNKMRRQSLPSQEIFYFHPVHGINRRTTLNLADPAVLAPDEQGILTAWV